MEVFVSPETDPCINLGLESYFLEHYEGEGCLVYRNAPCVIIGKNQNPYRELDLEFCKAKQIPFYRRISGGGAVYHDLGNINTAFFGKRVGISENLYQLWTKPMIQFLGYLSLEVSPDGRNGLVLNDKKISGSAQALKRERYLHHATLLHSADLEQLRSALTPEKELVSGQGVHSMSSPVTNLSGHLGELKDAEQLQELWVQFLMLWQNFGRQNEMPEEPWLMAEELKKNQFNTWDWNVARSPQFEISLSSNIGDVALGVEKGMITKVERNEDSDEKEKWDGLIGKPLKVGSFEAAGILTEIDKYIF